METLEETIHRVVSEVPRRLASQLVDKKFKAQGIKLSRKRLEAFMDHILSGRKDTFEFKQRGLSSKEITVEFSDEDGAELERKINDFQENQLPRVVENVTESTAKITLRSLKERWPEESREQNLELDKFRKNLHLRWGKGLELLKMLITIAREFGGNINEKLRSEGKTPDRALMEVLTRLHARACQVANEVVWLLAGGFADGAMARWRTLHEIAVVALLMKKHGEELAKAYLDHQAVDSRKAALQHEKHCKKLGQRPFSKQEQAQFEKRYQARLAKYGKDFGSQYSWASQALKIRQPTFAQLQEAADIDHLAPYYKLASHNVHAHAKGFCRLGLIGEEDILIAGPSNAGLADPGHAAAIALNQVSGTLWDLDPAFDNLVAMKIMHKLTDEIGDAFIKAHRQLLRDDHQVRPSTNRRTLKRSRKKVSAPVP